MSMLEVYVHEIKQHAAMAPCDHTLKRFVLQDGIAGKLKVNGHQNSWIALKCDSCSPTALCLFLDLQSPSKGLLSLYSGVRVTLKEHK